MAHNLRGAPRWLLLPAVSAAGGALAFWGGKGPQAWDWPMGLAVGLAPGLAAALTARRVIAPVLALVAGALGAAAAGNDPLRDLASSVATGVVLPAVTAVPAFLTAVRLREGFSWSWVNLLLQPLAALLVPAYLWFHGVPVEGSHFVPFLVLAAGHVAAVEIAAYLCPRTD